MHLSQLCLCKPHACLCKSRTTCLCKSHTFPHLLNFGKLHNGEQVCEQGFTQIYVCKQSTEILSVRKNQTLPDQKSSFFRYVQLSRNPLWLLCSHNKFLADYEFNTIAGGYIFFLDLAIFSTRAYVDKYLLTSLALFFSCRQLRTTKIARPWCAAEMAPSTVCGRGTAKVRPSTSPPTSWANVGLLGSAINPWRHCILRYFRRRQFLLHK